MKDINIEAVWTTEAGMPAVIIMVGKNPGYHHRCGYVQLAKESPLFRRGYSEQLPFITQEQVSNTILGKKGVMIAFTAVINSDGEDLVRRSLDVIIDVHGGLTYSGNLNERLGIEEPSWWFGFDTAHCDDDLDGGGRPLDYCIVECESMAKQLREVETNATKIQDNSDTRRIGSIGEASSGDSINQSNTIEDTSQSESPVS